MLRKWDVKTIKKKVSPKSFAGSVEVLEEGFSAMIVSLSWKTWEEHRFE